MFHSNTYKVIGKIGSGSGGTVYKAIHLRLNKEVVIKEIRKGNSEVLSDRTEVDVLKGIKHSYLPQVYDFIEDDSGAYTVMDHINGSDVQKLVKSGVIFSERRVLSCAKKLCEAVIYLHSLKPAVIHSDIKPANIMIGENDDICLIDFNVSRLFDKNDTSALGGTPGYAAPEQLGIPYSDIAAFRNGNYQGRVLTERIGTEKCMADERTDIFGIGASLYYMITGVMPSVSYCSEPIAALRSGVSEGLDHIIMKAMHPIPSRRYRSVSEMLKAIHNIAKIDKRYRMYSVQRAAVTGCAALMLLVGADLSRNGYMRLNEEKENKYYTLIEETQAAIELKEYDKAEEKIALASGLYPDRLKPYYDRLFIMHEKEEYERCIVYPDTVLSTSILGDDHNGDILKSNFYALAADSAFEEERYKEAADLFNRALYHYDQNADCYRDAAIAMARTGDVKAAEEILKKAAAASVSNDQLTLMSGEIFWANGAYDAAFGALSDAAANATSPYLRFRALLACYNMSNSDDAIFADKERRTAKLLSKYRGRIADEYAVPFMEMLAYQYNRCAAVLEDERYYPEALECYESLEKGNSLNYTSRKNYISVCEKVKDYKKCLALLSDMESENDKDYWVHMERSYILYYIEQEKTDGRNFSEAYNSYTKAQELYSERVNSTGISDPNMDTLRSFMTMIKENGML